jgi:hypothetical protein
LKRVAAAALGVASLGFPAAAPAQDGAPASEPVLTPAQASAELAEAVDALDAPAGAPVDATDELRDVAAALPYLEGAERRRAHAILARPPAGEPGPDFGAAKWSGGQTNNREFYDSPGGQFRVHYTTVGEHAPPSTDLLPMNGVPDYVELVAAYADESEQVENDDLGWPEPKSDGALGDTEVGTGQTDRTDIYLSDLCCASGVLYGYAGPDDASAQCNTPPFRCFAYLVLDDDYAEDGYGYEGDPDIPLAVTVAHEYNHILQFNIDAMQDSWMFESTAVWAEQQVFEDKNDWLFYVDIWANGPGVPITKFGGQGGSRVYGSAVWNHWLDRGAGFGPDVVLDSWKSSRQTSPKDFAVAAFDRGIQEHGGPGFAKEFGLFAAATAEWRVPGFDFPDHEQYPDVKREGGLKRGGAKAFELDHTAYRLLRVQPGTADALKLKVRAARRVRSAIALVGRQGAPETGVVTTEFKYLSRGGRGSVRLANVQDFDRITAVVANADGRVRGFGAGDWNYTRDNERFRVALRGD